MKKISMIMIALILAGVWSCKPKVADEGGRRAGWVKMPGGIDRYYLVTAGQISPEDKQLSFPVRKQNALRASGEIAKRNFLEKIVGSFLAAKTETEKATLKADTIKSGVSGVVPSPVAEEYKEYDEGAAVEVLWFFEAKGLRDLMSKRMEEIVKSQNVTQ
jgi:hypothetical protein